jgi:hypothetical protein
MHMKKACLFPLILATAALGCHAQVPPTTYSVSLTWTAPAASGSWAGCGTGQPACSYVLSRASVASGTTACPATTGSNYTPLNQSAPATGTSYSDASATGSVCYVAQTVQSGAYSQPSSPSNVIVVPGLPSAPGIPGGTATETQAQMETPATPLLSGKPTSLSLAGPQTLVARLGR